MVAAIAGDSDSLGAARISRHLLLLSQSLLPRVLSRSTGMRGRRVASAPLQWGDAPSLHSAKSASLFSVCRDHLSDHSLVRRNNCVLVSLGERKAFRRGGRFVSSAGEYRSADRLHSVVSFAQAHRGRQCRLLLVRGCRWATTQRLARRFIS